MGIVRHQDLKYYAERSCLSKANLTLEEANRIIDDAAKDKLLLYFYKCQMCNSYHLTSREPGQKDYVEFI